MLRHFVKYVMLVIVCVVVAITSSKTSVSDEVAWETKHFYVKTDVAIRDISYVKFVGESYGELNKQIKKFAMHLCDDVVAMNETGEELNRNGEMNLDTTMVDYNKDGLIVVELHSDLGVGWDGAYNGTLACYKGRMLTLPELICSPKEVAEIEAQLVDSNGDATTIKYIGEITANNFVGSYYIDDDRIIIQIGREHEYKDTNFAGELSVDLITAIERLNKLKICED